MKITQICFLAFAILTLTLPAHGKEPATVTVTGTGEVKVKPDIALISLRVQSKGKDAQKAQALNAKEMARVQDVLKSQFGIESKDIQTSSFSLNPEYRYDNNKTIFIGYIVEHSLSVTIRKLDKVGAVLDKVVGKNSEEIGVHLNGIQFDLDKRREVEVQALEQALANAKARAEALARFSKKTLGSVLQISDSQVRFQPIQGPMMRESAKMMMADAAAPETSISAGEIVVNASLHAQYQME